MGLALYRGYISMVSEWMSNGNLTSYIRTNPTVDRMGLCVGICAGLFYIHEKGMVHGDLKGANVMISSTGEPLIADFGNAHLRELTLRFTNTTNPGLSFRWAAPELFTEEDNKPNTKSDVYAYGMETFTGKIPFEDKSERWILKSLSLGTLSPNRPENGINDELWEILSSCWVRDPDTRPSMSVVMEQLRIAGMSALPASLEAELLRAPRIRPIELPPTPKLQTLEYPILEPSISKPWLVDLPPLELAPEEFCRQAFEWAEKDANERLANGDLTARYIFAGFPTWINWDFFTRLENAERLRDRFPPLRRITNTTDPAELMSIHDEWHATRNKWVDRFWDPAWAQFMHEEGGPIHKELAAEQQTPMGKALEAARGFNREKSDHLWAEFDFKRGYLWDKGYVHSNWQYIQRRPWRWCVEHENDQRRGARRAPLPRYYAGMSSDDWRDVRDMWHSTAIKWAEKRKDKSWLERDRREGITPEERHQLEQQFFQSLSDGVSVWEWDRIRQGLRLDPQSPSGSTELRFGSSLPTDIESVWSSETVA
ncbi:unnamed protein product [Rhizoctonia solani]|uniref:Protein kinase domain-containing protein n=1 Tax=Rhizoctonia solani TaxID=456999 RepID=A0A8H2WUR8_9AGAM|nr:unnamed protein product [Rhizoctonia solani]